MTFSSVLDGKSVTRYGLCWEMESDGRVTEIRSPRGARKNFRLGDQVRVTVARQPIGVSPGMLGKIKHILQPDFRNVAFAAHVLVLSFEGAPAESDHFFSLSEVEHTY